MISTDQFADLRAALDAGPTPGPWGIGDSDLPVSHLSIHSASGTHATIARMVKPEHRVWCAGEFVATWKFIAAANPEAIRALLAERDALREALTGITEKSSLVQSAADEIDRLRAALADMLDMYGGTRDCEGRRKDDYEMERINSAYAALTQQEQS